MIKINIIRPESLKEALNISLTSKEKNLFYFAGRTDLFVQAKEELITPAILIDISPFKELKGIKKIKNKLYIGALNTHAEIETNNLCKKYFPALCQASSEVGATQIHNLGTK